MIEIDLNCDLGESSTPAAQLQEEALMQYVSSVNIACGFHAGDAAIMQQTVASAIRKNLAIGAHPGFRDPANFGRKNIQIKPKEAYQITLYQVGALAAFVKAAGGRLNHVKPHGALYNMAAEDLSLSTAIAEAIADFDDSLVLYGLSGSKLIEAGKQKGLRVANEVFADRSYQSNGHLTPRSEPQALITNPAEALQQVISIIKFNYVTTVQKTRINVQADTICIHGDGEHALTLAKYIQDGLKEESIKVSGEKEW
ncbi:MAG: LamB/YcsF family protein [Chitinophagaceae bacterium]|nr:MAG: LamB/YcsF family protein [Chitinophagaceae bacterium]